MVYVCTGYTICGCTNIEECSVLCLFTGVYPTIPCVNELSNFLIGFSLQKCVSAPKFAKKAEDKTNS